MSGSSFHRDPSEPPHVPPQGPPVQGAPKEVYARMGEAGIRRMMEDFYAELERSSIRPMFPQDMKAASHKSADFFIFLLGGPALYHERHGSPMMRKRHLPFRIDEASRRVWLACFDKVLEGAEAKYGFPAEHRAAFRAFLDGFSSWMVNTR